MPLPCPPMQRSSRPLSHDRSLDAPRYAIARIRRVNVLPYVLGEKRKKVLSLAGEKIDMIAVQRRASQHHPMGMEGRCCNRRRAIVLEEAGVGL